MRERGGKSVDGAGNGSKKGRKSPRWAWARVPGLAGGPVLAAGVPFWGPGRLLG